MVRRKQDRDLLQSYREARYVVHAPSGDVRVQIGATSASIARLCAQLRASSWALVTACNPQSQRLSDDENHRRTGQLSRRVATLGYESYAATSGAAYASDAQCSSASGADEIAELLRPSWPDEPGLWLVHISAEQACELGREFGQRAIVVGDASGLGLLIDLKPSL